MAPGRLQALFPSHLLKNVQSLMTTVLAKIRKFEFFRKKKSLKPFKDSVMSAVLQFKENFYSRWQ